MVLLIRSDVIMAFNDFANNSTLGMFTYLFTLCFNLGEIISYVWDTSVF